MCIYAHIFIYINVLDDVQFYVCVDFFETEPPTNTSKMHQQDEGDPGATFTKGVSVNEHIYTYKRT